MKNQKDELKNEIKTGLEITVHADSQQLEEALAIVAEKRRQRGEEAIKNFPSSVMEAGEILVRTMADIGLVADKKTQQAYLDAVLEALNISITGMIESR